MLKLLCKGEDFPYTFTLNCLWSYDEKSSAANALLNRLIQMARSGDENAVFALNYWYKNVDYSGVN